jgi:hypothetical protein
LLDLYSLATITFLDRAKAPAPSRQRRNDCITFVYRLVGMLAVYTLLIASSVLTRR